MKRDAIITTADAPSEWASYTAEEILDAMAKAIELMPPNRLPMHVGDVEVLAHEYAPDGLVLVARDELTAKIWRALQEGQPAPLPVIVGYRWEHLELVIPPAFGDPPPQTVTLKL